MPKAGVFAEGAARIVAQAIVHQLGAGDAPGRHLGRGTCYIEFGGGRIGSVDIDFISGLTRTGSLNPPSVEQMDAGSCLAAVAEHAGSGCPHVV